MVDTFLLGYCDHARALLAHLEAAAASRIPRVCVLDPDPVVAGSLRARGVNASVVDFWDVASLRAAGVGSARTIVAFDERLGGSSEAFERVIRSIAPAARFVAVPASTSAVTAQELFPLAPLHRVVTSWRFWALVGVTLVDALVFVAPLTALALVASALLNPRWLRSAAHFLDDLAEAR